MKRLDVFSDVEIHNLFNSKCISKPWNFIDLD